VGAGYSDLALRTSKWKFPSSRKYLAFTNPVQSPTIPEGDILTERALALSVSRSSTSLSDRAMTGDMSAIQDKASGPRPKAGSFSRRRRPGVTELIPGPMATVQESSVDSRMLAALLQLINIELTVSLSYHSWEAANTQDHQDYTT
jgi:hypothetical protein